MTATERPALAEKDPLRECIAALAERYENTSRDNRIRPDVIAAHLRDVLAAEAAVAAVPEAERRSIPTDAELDALVLLVRDAARGGCGSHQGCRDLVAKKQRDAARRWFIDRNLNTPPGTEGGGA